MAVKTVVLLCLSLAFAWSTPTLAADSYDNCTGFITTLPATIEAPGTWCLRGDLSTSQSTGTAVRVYADNVTIDCNHSSIDGTAAGKDTGAFGIVGANLHDVTIRHCSIRGFLYGLMLSDRNGGGHTVEDNRFDDNTTVGIQVIGDGSVVRRNLVRNTGGSTSSPSAIGIETVGTVVVEANTVSGVIASDGGNAIGIAAQDSYGSITGNLVRGLAKGVQVGDVAYGIYNYNSGGERLTIRDNDLTGFAEPNSYGLTCLLEGTNAKDNVIKGFATAILGCGAESGNDITP